MPYLLGGLAVVGILAISLVMIFILQSLISPDAFVGTLSDPSYQVCNLGKQWILYSCKPNPLTGLGCIVPHSDNRFLTYKTVAVESPICYPDRDGGVRVVSWVWEQQGTATPCSSQTGGTGCCEYASRCTHTASYLCVRTTAREGGERQCTPDYLPIPYPEFNASANDYSVTPIELHIPCRENFCGTTA